jgi:ABC-type transporter Mla subunit MlaD
MSQRASQLEKLNQLLNEQVRLTSAIRDAASSGNGLEKTNADLNSMSGALKEVIGKMAGLGTETNSVTEQSVKMTPKLRAAWSVFESGIDDVKKAFGTVKKAGSDFFSTTKKQITSLIGVFGAVTRGIVGIGSALIAVPLKIMDFMQQKAADAANASQALREAFEEVRDKFGDLASNEGKAVIDSYKDLT